MQQAQETTSKYQSSVGVVLRGRDGRVLMCRDASAGEYAWQFPERTLRPDESLEAGVWQAIHETLGLASPQHLCRMVGRGPATRISFCKPCGGQIGTEHTYVLVAFDGDRSDNALDVMRWVEPEEALELVLPSRRHALRATLEASAPTPQPA